MNVEKKLLRGTKGTNGRGQTEKGKVAEYGEGRVLSTTYPCTVGKDRAQQEITIILFVFFFFFLVAILGIKSKAFHIPDKCFTTKLSQAQLFILLLITVSPWSMVWMGKTAPEW